MEESDSLDNDYVPRRTMVAYKEVYGATLKTKNNSMKFTKGTDPADV
jgi:hypothetical protein